MSPRETMAAEYALGLLEGAELLEARGLMANDTDFAQQVGWWEDRLAPLFDELGEMNPPANLWERIQAAIDDPAPPAETVLLRHRLRIWQGAATLAALAAAVLAFFTFVVPLPGSGPTPQAAPLVASLDLGKDKPRIGVTVMPGAKEMLVSTAGIASDGKHQHQLWLVPASGDPRSLGVLTADHENRMAIPPMLAGRLDQGATLAVSVEPIGGSTTGLPTGPVVATAKLQKI
ncbi:MAG: anti-sigma factor [Sphingomonadaceae bacterium]